MRPYGKLRCLGLLLCLGVLAACAPAQVPAQAQADPPRLEGSVVPGTIGIAVRSSANGVVVSAVRPGSAAERAGIRAGDRIAGYNGRPVRNARELERLVLDSVPGRIAHLEVSRGGAPRTIDVPVEQIRTAIRV